MSLTIFSTFVNFCPVFPTQTLSLPAPEMTPPQFKNPTTHVQEIPTKRVPASMQPINADLKSSQPTKSVTSASDGHHAQTSIYSGSTAPSSKDKVSSTRSISQWPGKNGNDDGSSTKDVTTGPDQPLQTTRTMNTYTTSIFAAHVTLAPLETGECQ